MIGTVALRVYSTNLSEVKKGSVYWKHKGKGSIGTVIVKSPVRLTEGCYVLSGKMEPGGIFTVETYRSASADSVKYVNSFFLSGTVKGIYPFRKFFRLHVEENGAVWPVDFNWIEGVEVGSSILVHGYLSRTKRELVLKATFAEFSLKTIGIGEQS